MVAEAILESFVRVTEIKVTVHKPHAPIAATFADVGVTLVRSAATVAESMADALMAFGGNVGDVRDTFDRALAEFCDGVMSA